MPDSSAPAVAIAVVYDVGFRSEPEGMTGFAHLFEHLMFEGSVTLEKGQHDKLVTGNGGVMNGSTRSDYTNYYEQLPSNALELGLYLEADRMRGLRLSDENVQNQIAVVKEEIRVNVVNQPFGGFPWILLPPVMFTTFANAHNGYGSFVDLEAATVDQASDFFDRYYAPGNATLVVAGDLEVDPTREMIERHFGPIPGRAVPPLASFAEPVPTEERRAIHHDPLAPLAAVAVAYRVPDPINEWEDYVAAAVLTDLLADGTASRLYQRLVKRDQLASHVGAMLGTFGDPFDVRDPTMLQLLAYHSGRRHRTPPRGHRRGSGGGRRRRRHRGGGRPGGDHHDGPDHPPARRHHGPGAGRRRPRAAAGPGRAAERAARPAGGGDARRHRPGGGPMVDSPTSRAVLEVVPGGEQ